ncbi:hypothetical protein OIDMADRAFT_48399 [Oidiodendron maius Zn]|uniref:Uncharacterized protein n=1 Tax=Oidiodendron maius (strain Zn) TaxID=913774 RepID=A0A0C3I291_OIDMZ|nr:hypothetical protein OIDMADRAFT_48399 [Oidiodendron maius Zn]
MPHNSEEEHVPSIEDFVASICPELKEAIILSPKTFNAVSCIIKVNQVMRGTDISTYLFASNAVGATFTRLLDASRIMSRIGVYDKKCRIFSQQWLFGNKVLDLSMGLISPAELAEEPLEAAERAL